MVNLSKRITGIDEIMDDFQLPASELEPVLKGLGKLNAWFGGHKNLISALQDFPVQQNCHISDWGCGGGDTLRAVANWAQQHKLNFKLTGIDAAPATVAFAKKETAGYPEIDFQKMDVMKDTFPDGQFDIVMSNLFSHHFEDEDWIVLVKKMLAAARHGVIITDLHRHRALYYALAFIFGAVIPNKMMRNDGLLSVKRSFTKPELIALLRQANINHYKIKWRWAFQWQVIIYKP